MAAYSNFAYSTIATAPSPAASGPSLVVQSGDGAKFPAAPFKVTIWPASSQPTTANAEIALCTAVSTDTLTITRTQEGSSARTVVTGDQIAQTITAAEFAFPSFDLEPDFTTYIPDGYGAVVPGEVILDSNIELVVGGTGAKTELAIV